MPLYDFKCRKCEAVFEKLAPSDVKVMPCYECPPKHIVLNLNEPIDIQYLADRLLSAPASIRMADMTVLNKRRQRIREPIWRDLKTGAIEPVHP